MIIKSLHIENFMPYNGEVSLDFNVGRNFILGKNNIGKSNLFNAFYWLLFGEVFDKKKGKINVDRDKHYSLVNKMAIKTSEDNLGDKVICKVTMKVDDYKDDNNAWNNIEITRTAEAYKQDDNWFLNPSICEYSYVDNRDTESSSNKEEFTLFIDKLFPLEIRKYIWFQGEDIDRLINLDQGADFEKALNNISYYPKYQRLYDISNDSLDYVSTEKSKKLRAAEKGNKKFLNIEQELGVLKTQVKSQIEKRDEYQEKIRNVSGVISKLEDTLYAFDEFQEIDKDRTKYKSDKEKWVRIQEEIEERQLRNFRSTWLLKGTESLIQTAETEIKNYEKELNKGFVSIEVPDETFLNKCIDSKKCLVCLSDGSVIVENISNRLKAQKDALQERSINRELDKNLTRFFSITNEILPSIISIESDMERIDQKKDESQSEIEKNSKLYVEANDRINSLANKHNITIGLAIKQNKDNKIGFNTHTKNKSDYQSKLNGVEREIIRLETSIENKELELKKAATKGNTSKIEEIEIEQILKLINNAVIEVKESELDRILNLVENKANELYHSMTDHTMTVTGDIKIHREYYDIGLFDKDDNRVPISKGYETILKMCIINSIVKISEGVVDSPPFICDAPTSNLDSDHSQAYYASIDFEQSIIFTKDFNDETKKKLKKDKDVASVYELEAMGSGNMNDTKTTISRLK